jgi:multiple sugar transport system substrate-binding protein
MGGTGLDRTVWLWVIQEAGMSEQLKRQVITLGGKQISRRGVLKGSAALGVAAATGSAIFAAPMVNAQEKAPVVFWTTHSDIGLEALQKIGEEFNAQSTTSQVEVVKRPDAEVTDSSSLITAVRGGEGPDAYLLDRFIVAERAANGVLEDLTPLLENAGENTDLREKYVDFSAAEATYNDSVFALPFDTDVRALFYNKKLFTDAGVDISVLDPANGPITYDQLAELAIPLNKDDGTNFTQVGYIPYFGQAGSIYTDGFAWGGEFFDYENCVVTPDNERVVAAAQWGQDYINGLGADKLYAFAQNAMRTGSQPTDSPFNQQRLGAMIDGNWQFPSFAKYLPGVDIGYTFTPVPAAGDTSHTWAGGWSGVIPLGAKNPEGGFEFIQYLCGPNGSRTYVTMNNNLPVLRELLADASLFSEDLNWFVQNLFPTTKNRPPLPVGARYWDELKSAWERIYLNQSDVASSMEQAKQNVQGDIDAGGYCPIAPPPAPEGTPAS